ncbi:MAG TPA: tetratricopeptide repeat protein [Xanthobacteraceae bacterium]|nr:tetratricopeptide repeat protein [Xanthobacteraceae bacterium]
MTDIFQEVDEEVRREQLKRLWERYGTYLIAACVLIVAGVGAWRGYDWWQAKQAAKSGAAFEQAVALAQSGKHEEAAAAFAKLAADGTASYRVLARLREAAELSSSDKKAAVTAYDAIATDKSAGQVIEDLAAVRAGLLLVDMAPYPEIRTRLEPLTAADRPFRHSAREILALSAWKNGDTAEARRWTELMMGDPQTPPGARSRAEILSELIAAASAKG